MTDRELLELLVQKVSSMEQGMQGMGKRMQGMEQRMESMEKDLRDIKAGQIRMEQDHGAKITALFDGYTLRGDQIERLQQHLDERLDAIQTDLSYVVSKTAQHERKFIQLNKSTNPRSLLPRK